MTDLEADREWWDAEAANDPRYASRRWGGDGTEHQIDTTIHSILLMIKSALREPVGGFVLELGCGPGRLIHRLGEMYPQAQLRGFDISPAMGAICNADAPENVLAINTNGSILPVADKVASFAYSVEMFQHCAPDIVFAYLVELNRVLKRGATAILQFVERGDEGPYAHPIRWDALRQLILDANLRIYSVQPGVVHDEWVWVTVGPKP